MPFYERLAIAMGLILVDAVVFAVPLTALVLGYILLARPAWFKDWILKLYG